MQIKYKIFEKTKKAMYFFKEVNNFELNRKPFF